MTKFIKSGDELINVNSITAANVHTSHKNTPPYSEHVLVKHYDSEGGELVLKSLIFQMKMKDFIEKINELYKSDLAVLSF